MRLTLLLFILFGSLNLSTHLTDDYHFSIVKYDQTFYLESCHPIAIYKSNLWIPNELDENGNIEVDHRFEVSFGRQTKGEYQKKAPDEIILLVGTRWEGNCLLFPLDDDDMENAADLLIEITQLDREQITITYK